MRCVLRDLVPLVLFTRLPGPSSGPQTDNNSGNRARFWIAVPPGFCHLCAKERHYVEREKSFTKSTAHASLARLCVRKSGPLSLSRSLVDAGDTGKAVETGIKTQNSLNSMVLHDGEMHSVTRGKMAIRQHNLPGTICNFPVNR